MHSVDPSFSALSQCLQSHGQETQYRHEWFSTCIINELAPRRVYLCWLRQSNRSIFCITSCCLSLRLPALLLGWEAEKLPAQIVSRPAWLCIQSRSETGRGKQRPGGAASCQTARCMIEDNPELERKHFRGPRSALSPCCFSSSLAGSWSSLRMEEKVHV